MIPSVEALRALSRHRGDAVVVATMTGLAEWNTVSKQPDLDVPLTDTMGKASSFGLGLALAQPERQVIVIDGDGSLLTNLGSLATVGNVAPRNFVHLVLQNGTYASMGGQRVPGGDAVSFAGLALASGYAAAHTFDDLEDFVTDVEDILNTPGPVLVCLRVRHDGIPPTTVDERTLADAVRELTARLRSNS